jgi:hypothetical protein
VAEGSGGKRSFEQRRLFFSARGARQPPQLSFEQVKIDSFGDELGGAVFASEPVAFVVALAGPPIGDKRVPRDGLGPLWRAIGQAGSEKVPLTAEGAANEARRFASACAVAGVELIKSSIMGVEGVMGFYLYLFYLRIFVRTRHGDGCNTISS